MLLLCAPAPTVPGLTENSHYKMQPSGASSVGGVMRSPGPARRRCFPSAVFAQIQGAASLSLKSRPSPASRAQRGPLYQSRLTGGHGPAPGEACERLPAPGHGHGGTCPSESGLHAPAAAGAAGIAQGPARERARPPRALPARSADVALPRPAPAQAALPERSRMVLLESEQVRGRGPPGVKRAMRAAAGGTSERGRGGGREGGPQSPEATPGPRWRRLHGSHCGGGERASRTLANLSRRGRSAGAAGGPGSSEFMFGVRTAGRAAPGWDFVSCSLSRVRLSSVLPSAGGREPGPGRGEELGGRVVAPSHGRVSFSCSS